VPFYILLGNHDYSRGRQDRFELEYAKKNPQSRWKMPARWYRLELPSADDPLVTVLMLDGNYLFLSKDEWREQAEWMAAELEKPRTARWLVMCAHQPLYTNGGRGDDDRLLREWGPLLEPNGVDFYLSAHDHNLQHVQIPGVATTFVISGGGGANLHDIIRTDRGPFAAEMHRFAHLRFGERSADVHLLDAGGRPVHAFTTTPLRPRNVAAAATATPTTTSKPAPVPAGAPERVR
ncbi:MAG: metallophosphoesterase, partial [Planctomycetota bacterium]|nr:metallophosphoesterase [Planctomycetota bacterium]